MKYNLNVPVVDVEMKPIIEEYGIFTVDKMLKNILVEYTGEKMVDVFGAMMKLNQLQDGVADFTTDEIACLRDAIKKADKRSSFYRQQALNAIDDKQILPEKETPKNVKNTK